MLSRLVRSQLIIFSIASVIGVSTMIFGYLQVPTWLGIGHYSVTVDLAGTGGLYRFANVTYRGVQIGKVTAVEPTKTGATATMSLDSAHQIPADVVAHVRSVSAVGEQYVDLIPRSSAPPFLRDGSVIAERDTTIPVQAGRVLDELAALVKSVPKGALTELLDESHLAFDGAGYDVGSLLDSAAVIAADANATAGQTRTLIDDTAPLLDSQAATTDSLRVWVRDLAGVTDELRANDRELRTVLSGGADAEDEAARLLNQLKPTLPVLLANLSTVGEIGVTYNPSLRQLLVLLPPYVAGFGSLSQMNNPMGLSLGGFTLMNGDPPPCTVGFLPPSQWRSPADESVIDTPDGLYCKLPQDSPIAVRGVRNNPCMDQPGKRAPSVELCRSDRPYEPLAMRQHVLGPTPFDPNLVSQGVPLDDRVLPDERIYGPVDGTPLPPAEPAPSQPTGGPVGAGTASYDPGTGRYIGTDGQVYQQDDLRTGNQPANWTDLMPR